MGRWHKASLASLDVMTCGIKRRLLTHDGEHAQPDFTAGRFGAALEKAIRWGANNDEQLKRFALGGALLRIRSMESSETVAGQDAYGETTLSNLT
jgi:hypothetical protein